MQLNRAQSPQTKTVTKISLPEIEKTNLTNGIPVFSINAGTQDVVKIQLVFKAGIWYQAHSLEAFFTGQMLEEGSRNYSAAQIADKLDDCGAFVHKKVGRDNACIDIFTLNKHLKSVLEIVSDIVKNPLFGESQLNRLREQEKQDFEVRNQKVKHLAQKQFSSLLFGENHPYGRFAKLEDYSILNPSILRDFHQKHYGSGNCRIFMSGKISSSTLQQLNEFFGQEKWGASEEINTLSVTAESSKKLKHYLPKDKVLQSAIRMGKRSIGRNHPDYFALNVTSTIFGGYFGSRLMSNIREDKGYTYGIYAGVTPNIQDSSFTISSEVGADVAQKAIDEIRFELKRLRTEEVPIEELSLVKNYISGTFLRTLNGPFALGEVIKSLYENQLPENYYQQYLDKIHAINPKEVKSIANQYLHEDQMLELVVGKK